MRIQDVRDCAAPVQLGVALAAFWILAAVPVLAQSDWAEANKVVGAIGGWRTYAKERAEPPEGYPTVPDEAEALLPSEVLAAAVSIDSETQLAAWESRRYAERSASIEPPTVSLARTSGDADTGSAVGVHVPVGSWIRRSLSLAADDEAWGIAERHVLELQATRNRLIAYADAVTAKAELARAVDRLEVQAILEELTQRQRKIGAVPEFELLSLQIDRTDAEGAKASASEAAVRAAERLALEMGKPLDHAVELQRRLPLELSTPGNLPVPGEKGRLDVRAAEDGLAQQRASLSRDRSGLWIGGLEVGVLQERFDSGEVNNTLELSWRLPFGGNASRQVDLGERIVRERTLQLRNVQQNAERELVEADRAKRIAGQILQQSEEALGSAEAWMEEQVYRYSGMLIGPHDILRAAARLRQVQSRYITARRSAFVAALDAHFVRTIPTRAMIPAQSAMPAATPDAGH